MKRMFTVTDAEAAQLKNAIRSFRLRLHSCLRQRGSASRVHFYGRVITPASKLAGDPDPARPFRLLPAGRIKPVAPLPGLLLGVLDGGSLEQRVLRLMDRRLLWASQWRVASAVACGAVVAMVCAGAMTFGLQNTLAQSDMPEWQRVAGGKMSFEVASIRENKDPVGPGNQPRTNFPLGAVTLYGHPGVVFSVKNQTALDLINFAYYLTGMEGHRTLDSQLPEWAKTARFNVEARAAAGTEPTKDQMRLMVQSLLAERFHLKLHREAKETSAYVVQLLEPGKLGPQLKPHPADVPCVFELQKRAPGGPIPPAIADDGLPPECGNVRAPVQTREMYKYVARGVKSDEIAKMLSVWIDDNRPVVDRTGLSGIYDWVITFEPAVFADTPPGTPRSQGDLYGPSLAQSLRKQLGLKVDLTKTPVETLMIDQVERPTEN